MRSIGYGDEDCTEKEYEENIWMMNYWRIDAKEGLAAAEEWLDKKKLERAVLDRLI